MIKSFQKGGRKVVEGSMQGVRVDGLPAIDASYSRDSCGYHAVNG